MNGLNMEPCLSYGFADRFVCRKCGISPNIIKTEGVNPIVVTFECHGEKTTMQVNKSDLLRTKKVFGTPEAYEEGSGEQLIVK